MQVIALQSIPKQSLSIALDGVLYDIDVLSTNGCMSLNITRANVRVVSGQRAVAGQLVLPFKVDEDGAGNFMFLTQDDDLPAYLKFNSTQAFLYATNAELAAVRDGGGREFVAFDFVTLSGAGVAVGAASAHGVGAHV